MFNIKFSFSFVRLITDLRKITIIQKLKVIHYKNNSLLSVDFNLVIKRLSEFFNDDMQ